MRHSVVAKASTTTGWRKYVNAIIAHDISAATRYYDRVIQWLPREGDQGLLLDQIDAPQKLMVSQEDGFPDISEELDRRTTVLINGTLNHHHDIQALLAGLKAKLSRTSRLALVLYNPYLRWLYQIANKLGIRRGELPTTFLTCSDVANLARLTDFTIVCQRAGVYFPFKLLGLGDLVNRLLPLVPVVRWLGLVFHVVLRPIIPRQSAGLSCVIPARNERGNIESALQRFPDLGCPVEILFVEGHSTDGTWEEIQRVATAYEGRFRIHSFQQAGAGKADAVRLGFSRASNELLTILDADLTMPPEMIGRFYQAYGEGLADFVNGSRLLYSMEGQAMRFLNRLGNIFFAKTLSWVLDMRIGDSLCGTKLLTRHDYQRMIRWREDFGDFDPFGDFELLFPASVLWLGSVDIPVRYRARTYGSTNIRRFSDGLQLFKMTLVGLFRIKLGYRVNRPKKAGVAEQHDHRNQIRFSLRDLMLVIAGSSALIAALGWIGRASEQGGWFYALYSIPIIAGMTGLLLRRFWGGVIGALVGGFVLWSVLMMIG